MKFERKVMIICSLLLGITLSGCAHKESSKVIKPIPSKSTEAFQTETPSYNYTPQLRDSPRNLFTGDSIGYYINSNNDLYKYNREESTFVLPSITRIFNGGGGVFAIDTNGFVWGWGCEWLDYNVPQKIEGLSNVKSVVSGLQLINESETGGTYSVFLLENGEIYVAGIGLDLDNVNYPNYEFYPLDVSTVFHYTQPTKIKYHGKAKDILPIEYGNFAILLDNNDLINVNFKNNKNKIEEKFLVKGFEELMILNSFNIARTNDGFYGWGSISYATDNEPEMYSFEFPTKLAGMEPILSCSEQLVGMNDGSLWLRKRGYLFPEGKQVENVENVVYVLYDLALTADGSLYYIYEEKPPLKIADTGFTFNFKKSSDHYILNSDDDFWKYGGYSQ